MKEKTCYLVWQVFFLLLIVGLAVLTKPRVRDWRGATQGAVRSGTKHRSERGAPQSPTPTSHNCKK